MGCLYKISFPNGKIYIGITSKSLRNRIQSHVTLALGNGKRKNLVHHAIKKFNGEIKAVELLFCGNFELLKLLEVKAIAHYNSKSPFGYNLSDGGEGLLNPPKEVRDKISNAGIGRKHSPESRERISKALTGKKKSASQVEAMKKVPGVKWTKERKLKFSEFRKGKRHSAETIEVMKKAAINRWSKQKEK